MEYTIKIGFEGLEELMECYRQETIQNLKRWIGEDKIKGKDSSVFEDDLEYFKEASTEQLIRRFLIQQLIVYEVKKTATQNE